MPWVPGWVAVGPGGHSPCSHVLQGEVGVSQASGAKGCLEHAQAGTPIREVSLGFRGGVGHSPARPHRVEGFRLVAVALPSCSPLPRASPSRRTLPSAGGSGDAEKTRLSNPPLLRRAVSNGVFSVS